MINGRIPLAVPVVGAAEAANLQACIDTTFVSSVGPFVTEFERKVAEATGGIEAVATSAGTTGLHAALVALGVERDDLVICPSFTFIASANAISHAGATPWLFDIDESWVIDLDQVEAALDRETERRGGDRIHTATGRRVAAMLPVLTLGNASRPERLRALAERFGLPVLVDAAAALGGDAWGEPIAALGELAVISFNGNKIATAGGGGAVVGRDGDLLRELRHLTTTARVSADYSHDRVGFNYRMTNLQAAVGCAQMDRLPDFVAAKRRIAARYAEALADLPGIRGFPQTPGSNCWFSGVVLDAGAPMAAAELAARLNGDGIEARTFWKPVHLQAPYADAPRVTMDRCEDLWSRIVTLPCSTNLSDSDQGRVIAATRSALGSA
ncbi:aminotransferase class I/II-fold pyridoxal phosphate-dependent enzyme [Brevundimonas lutea]|uniref:aminotransferase class I/II-fold pyridoxal phosphate-dependent enzyme n=1 Tax=Brevundimonas lutea TaxID=2293980 RepID=UPI000F033332|nr:aminotransferase class I/II-fold pyridoxal phosphate-dependent enzyme [Brevundimonas lutea]